MAKARTSQALMTQRLYMLASLAVALGVLLFLIVTFKYIRLRASWHNYAVQMLSSMDQSAWQRSVDNATMVATTVGQFPEGSPFIKQSAQLEKLVTKMSAESQHDIVVIDTNKTIWADTISANVGTKFTEDKNNAVAETIADGTPRSFTEQSGDYPNGLSQVVVPMKDAAGKTIGAVVLSVDVTTK